jgi:hypothetical protein
MASDGSTFEIGIKATGGDSAAAEIHKITAIANETVVVINQFNASTYQFVAAQEEAAEAAKKSSGALGDLGAAVTASSSATSAYNALIKGDYLSAMLAGQKATEAFNTALKSNPMSLVVVGITLALNALHSFIKKQEEARTASEKAIEKMRDAQKSEATRAQEIHEAAEKGANAAKLRIDALTKVLREGTKAAEEMRAQLDA